MKLSSYKSAKAFPCIDDLVDMEQPPRQENGLISLDWSKNSRRPKMSLGLPPYPPNYIAERERFACFRKTGLRCFEVQARPHLGGWKTPVRT